MVEPLNTKPIITKLLEKTKAGRVDWEDHGNGFQCNLDGEYLFRVYKVEDSYGIIMLDKYQNEIFRETATEEIYFRNPRDEERLQFFQDLYELARRRAVKANEKIAGVDAVLDKI